MDIPLIKNYIKFKYYFYKNKILFIFYFRKKLVFKISIGAINIYINYIFFIFIYILNKKYAFKLSMNAKLNDISLFLTNIVSLDEYTSSLKDNDIEKKDQLFRKNVDFLFLKNIFLHLFEIELDDNINYNFSKNTIITRNIISKIENYIEEIKKYYIICKQKIYMEKLNEKKVITLLRQLLRTNNFELKSKEKYDNGKKYLLYTITKKKNKYLKKINSVMNFD